MIDGEKKKHALFFKLIHQYFIGKAIKEAALKGLFSNLYKEAKSLYSALVSEFLALKKSGNLNTTSPISRFLSGINGIDDFNVALGSENIDLERSEYYVEFGSTKFDDVLLSLSDLYAIFKRLTDQDQLLIKKRLHQWGNSKIKSAEY